MNVERLQRNFLSLCRIPSPSGRERRISEWIRRYVESLGCEVTEDGAALEGAAESTGNLYISMPGTGAGSTASRLPLFLSAHVDTVPVVFDDEIPVRVEGDRVDTGGASILGADDKSGVAIAIEMLESAVEHPGRLMHPLELILTVREEVGVEGGRHVDPSLVVARQGFNLDGETPVFSALNRAPFKMRYEIDVRGKSSHAALNPDAGINAIGAAAKIISELPGGILDELSTANVGKIAGGGATNVVPDLCTVVGELRSLDEELLSRWRQTIDSTVARVAANSRVDAKVTWNEQYKGYRIDETEPCVRLFRDAVEAAGHPPQLETSRGGGDANYLNAKGLRCIVFGLGMENIHSPAEYYLLSRLNEAASLLESILFERPETKT